MVGEYRFGGLDMRDPLILGPYLMRPILGNSHVPTKRGREYKLFKSPNLHIAPK